RPSGARSVLPRPRAAGGGARLVAERPTWPPDPPLPARPALVQTGAPPRHRVNRFGPPRNAPLWGSWLLDSGTRRYYFAGDSGYYHGFREIGRRFAPIDVAFLPIGAYEPRWFMRPQHADPGEAYQAFLDLGAHAMCSMHWGCFDLTDEPVDRAPKVLAEVLERAGADRERVRTMAVGQRWRIPPPEAGRRF